MVHFIPNILSKEECLYLTNRFDIEREKTSSYDDPNSYGKSFGFRPSYNFDKYLEILKPKVLEFDSSINTLNNVNTYVREYLNDSFLKKHIDRKDISVTMSICIESNINKEWPMFAKIDGIEYSFNTNVGDAILLFDADKTIHWRDTLICNENERVLQFFLHWIPVNYITKKTKSLL